MPQPQGKSITLDHAMEKANESSFEATCRQEADFPKFEDKLSIPRFDLSDLGILDRTSALLGDKNPFSKKATAAENEVWLLDNTAYKQKDSEIWEAEFVACYFLKGRKDVTKLVSRIADAIGIDGKVGMDDAIHKLMAERLQPFVSAIAPARSVAITIPSDDGPPQSRGLGPSNSNGISSQVFAIDGDSAADGKTVTYTNDGPEYPPCSGQTQFAGPDGWTIISDIDDTIKVTQSSNPIGILQTTFTQEPKTIEGMEDFYKQLDQHFHKPSWFYVSASPYNLYPFLRKFIHQYYIPGTIILRDASWMFFGGLLQSLTEGVQQYKESRVEKIHGWLPQRKVICIGDSTQKDPETYAAMYKKHPGWIKAIYIRKVIDVPFMEIRNTEKRFADAFKDVPSGVWRLFVTPNELADHLKTIQV